MARDDLSEKEALQRINAQMPLAEKCRRAQFMIDNCTTKEFTRQQTFTLYSELHRIAMKQKMFRAFLILLFAIGIVYYLITLLRFLY